MGSKFQSKTIKEYKKKGYIVLNVIKLSDSGYPDLLCMKDGVSTWIECKELKDTLKPLQKYRIDELIKQGFNAFCLQDQKGVIYPKEI
jgi:Holliday junction resolvase